MGKLRQRRGAAGDRPPARAEPAAGGGGSSIVPLLLAVCVALGALLAALSMTPASRQPRATAAVPPAPAPAPAPRARELTCAELKQAASAHFNAGQFQQAVDALIACANHNISEPSNVWNVGVMLARLKDYENAISWMEEALKLKPASVHYLKVGASMVLWL